LARNLSLVSIKKYVETNKTVAPQLFIKNGKPVNVDEYLARIGSKDYIPPKFDRNVYLMLPYRMFNIFPTVAVFSNRNINTGEVYPPHFFYKNRLVKRGKYLFIGKIPVDLARRAVVINNRLIPIKTIAVVAYEKNGKLIKKIQQINPEGLDLIILQSYGEAMLMDDYYFNSTFVQMFVFENYNKKLFKPVILSPWMKIYKIKND
jgi:dolichyl-diphosphooligosaccharide--protein glycosyltransferase/undecaprenyl-diphosphooligosaccharide--protein glycosyltransferase